MAITISGSGITSANIADGTIVNGDIHSGAAIDGSKLSGVGVDGIVSTATGIDVTGSVTADGLTSYTTTANSQLYLTSPDTGQSAVNFGGVSSNAKGSIRYSDNSDWMAFYANSAEKMRIDSSGSVFIGTTDTGGQSGGAVFVDEPYDRKTLKLSHSDTSGNRHLVQFYTTASALRVGYISTSTTAVTYATSSDYRLKEDVQPMSASIDRLKQLNPVNFAWKSNGSRVDGFIAHEAQDVVPECVTGTKDAMTAAVLYTADDELPDGKVIGDIKEASVPVYQGIDQSKLVPLLVASLQEAITRIEQLENA
jgi:hypothetical protein